MLQLLVVVVSQTQQRHGIRSLCAAQIHVDQPPGDILVFLTGQEEIEALARLINARFHPCCQLWFHSSLGMMIWIRQRTRPCCKSGPEVIGTCQGAVLESQPRWRQASRDSLRWHPPLHLDYASVKPEALPPFSRQAVVATGRQERGATAGFTIAM